MSAYASVSPSKLLQLTLFYGAADVDGNFLDRALSSKQRNGYASVLFYAAWCPFSHSLYPKFDILSSMFPQIEHLAVEESSASPRCAANCPALRFCLVESKENWKD
ncbi:hypothetical protein Golax_015027 [Gossypium laxum]|uniref:Thioredoxin domain-containing protein n=1 Tax=Gossypium laxum TaxID=34288 RepID=A0A7J8ZXY5_9ROSI|nr:hypothetical protein [Gossypium laxum]